MSTYEILETPSMCSYDWMVTNARSWTRGRSSAFDMCTDLR